MLDIQSHFDEVLSKYSNNQEDLVVAYSGGVDSTVILHLALQYAQKESKTLKAIHINHQISSNADAWQQHCEHQCELLGIKCYSVKVDVAKDAKKGLEAAARDARYEAIAQRLDNQSIVLLGQHQDDQGETLLLQLMRGAGPKGLSSMPEYKLQNNLHYLRPLLGVTRAQILDFAKNENLQWIEDESNQSTKFDRNFLRHQIVPVLQQRWPEANKVLAKSALRCADESQVLQEYMALLANDILGEDKSIFVDKFALLSDVTKTAFVRYWCELLNLPLPNATQLDQIVAFPDAKSDKQPQVNLGENVISKFNDKIYVYKTPSPQPQSQLISEFPFTISSANVRLSLAQTPESANFHLPNNSQLRVEYGVLTATIKPFSNRPTKALKDWCKEWNIPPWERQNIPLLMLGDKLLAVIAEQLYVDCAYAKPLIDSKGVSLERVTP
ncbi:tRNA lysidine(34) synthetase TilS [Glaciecola sp. 1036]|uniref:tRNA lysidine(34) synthetase TilS n=1 Tax=Alteromonadaceae TaxID=72275 RepID=UPI003CFF3EC7